MPEEKSLLASFLTYLSRPEYAAGCPDKSASSKFWDVFRLWSLLFVVAILLAALILAAAGIAGYNIRQHTVLDLVFDKPLFVVVFFAFIWAPVVEELTFRMWLKFSPRKLGFSAALILVMLAVMGLRLFSAQLGIPEEALNYSEPGTFLLYISSVLLIGSALSLVFKRAINKKAAKAFYSRHFRHIFLFSAALFALVHLLNYRELGQIWFFFPLLVAPQFFGGLVLGFVRMRYGLKWSVANHFIHNGITMLPVLALSFASKEVAGALRGGDASRLASVSLQDSLVLLSGSLLFILVLVVGGVLFALLLGEFSGKRGKARLKK